MTALILDVRLDGFADPVGTLIKDEFGALAFVYTDAHLAHPEAQPLSLSLPLRKDPYGDVITRSFFDNLLQERDGVLTRIMAREGLARDDIAGLLHHVGKDCAGALSVLPMDAPPVKVPGCYDRDYTAISNQELTAIVSALRDRKPLPEEVTDPSPLAGVQSKIAITKLPDGRFAMPNSGSGAPTTHILKVPDRDHPKDAVYECEALNLSRDLGFDTAAAEVMPVCGIDALLVARFDRAHNKAGEVIRLHQEDFAQALGLPPSLKYERYGQPGRRFDADAIRTVLDETDEPVKERDHFIGATFFDLLTGNVDAHAKNHGLFHLGPGRCQTTPRYDIMPTRLDPNLTDELPFRIGAAKKLGEITVDDVDAFLGKLGIATDAAKKRVRTRHANFIAKGLADKLEELSDKRLKVFADLIAANIRHLMPVLGLNVPRAAQNRDAYIARGGGWLKS